MSRVSRFAAAGVVALFFAFGSRIAEGAPPERSVSTSRQFVVYGPDARLRGAICDVAERVKRDALTLLHQPDGWRTPIVVNASLAQANAPELPPARLNLSQTGFGLKLQLDLSLGGDLSPPAIDRELLRAVLLEMMYRSEPNTPAGTAYVEPPPWLLEGMLALNAERDAAAIAERLGTVVSSVNMVSLEDFLRQTPALLDSPSRALYRAYAAAFASMLIRGAESRDALGRFIANLPNATNDPLADLQRHFPALVGTDKAQKIWEANLKRMATSDRYRLMTCEETERQLAALLRIEIAPAGKPATTYAFEEFPQFIRNPGLPVGLRAVNERLLVLSGRAHTLYQPIIREYQEIALLLHRGKTKRIPQRLAEARGTREQLTRRMSAIGDYMNWYEATQARTASGVFREYLKAAEFAAEQPLRRRRDPISVYLDAMEAQF
jgi:hypothetical protein